MRLLLASILALAAPAIGQEPTVEQIMEAYSKAGWFAIAQPAGKPPLVCIDKPGSDFVDDLVEHLAKRARLVRGI